jgi:NAD(P)-dependent dehydrogenase (short-subunit alcohol dehydrogenase family)
MAERLKDPVVLLTGAGGGIGTALTEALLAAGVAEIIAAGRGHPPAHARVRPERMAARLP